MSNQEIPEIRLYKDPLSDHLPLTRFKSAGTVGNRSKYGGQPDLIQPLDPADIECCFSAMIFYAQIDSFSPEFSIGDCGMAYLFYCRKCAGIKTITQCY